MKYKKYIIFDFDGTIYNSGPGVMKASRYALESFGIEVKNLNDLRGFNGPPLWDSFMKFYGFSREKADEAIKKYREYYNVLGLHDGEVYPGIPELLRDLHAVGKTLVLATSKAQQYFPELLIDLGLDGYFDIIAGATSDGSRSTKEQVLKYALEQIEISDMTQAVMVGDRKFDIIGAKTFGIQSVGVLYGYGDREEFETENADYIADGVKDLRKLLLGE